MIFLNLISLWLDNNYQIYRKVLQYLNFFPHPTKQGLNLGNSADAPINMHSRARAGAVSPPLHACIRLCVSVVVGRRPVHTGASVYVMTGASERGCRAEQATYKQV